jgi:hypothetical protein
MEGPWELVEVQDYGIYRYYILKSLSYFNFWRGVVTTPYGGKKDKTCIVDSTISVEAVRLSLITQGQRGA